MEMEEAESSKSIVEDGDPTVHEGFMREALAMAHLALSTDETPVGCVLVHNNKIISRGMNATNRTRNGTRHAEFEALSNLFSPLGDIPLQHRTTEEPLTLSPPPPLPDHPQSHHPPSPTTILPQSSLYVTIEPCIMCASLLRQYGIQKVYFGASNERFGGTGGVLNIHSDAIGGEKGYSVSGGWLREEAILLLRRFYGGENLGAPKPRKKGERKLNLDVEPLVDQAGGVGEAVLGDEQSNTDEKSRDKSDLPGDTMHEA